MNFTEAIVAAEESRHALTLRTAPGYLLICGGDDYLYHRMPKRSSFEPFTASVARILCTDWVLVPDQDWIQ